MSPTAIDLFLNATTLEMLSARISRLGDEGHTVEPDKATLVLLRVSFILARKTPRGVSIKRDIVPHAACLNSTRNVFCKVVGHESAK
eukprot:181653-Amphidinium_carterae.1